MKKLIIILFLVVLNVPAYAYTIRGATLRGFNNPTVTATFSPSDLTGLKLWLKADQGVYSDAGTTLANNNDTVQQWNDQSGQGNNASQPTALQRFIYKTNILNGKPVLRSAIGKALPIPSGVSFNNATTFMVFKPVTISAGAYRTAYIMPIAPLVLSTLADGSWGSYFGTDASSGVTLTANNFYILSVTINDANSANGITFGTNGSTSSGTGHGNSASAESGLNRATQDDDYDFVEMIVYDNPLSGTDRDKVRDYLNAKYAIY